MRPSGAILLVDDGPTGREVLQTLLAGQGYDLVFTESGSEALVKALELAPDLILLNTDRDNVEICRALRAAPALVQVPIVMAVGPDDRDSRLRGLEAGADTFVSRPFERIEVQAQVRALAQLGRCCRILLEQSQGNGDAGDAGGADGTAVGANMEAEIIKRNRQLLILQSAGVAITSSLDLQYVLSTITREMVNLLEMKACAILKWDQDTHSVSMLSEYGPDGWWERKWPAPAHDLAGLPLTELVLMERHARQITLDQPDVDPGEADYMRHTGIQILLKLPMAFQERVVGLVEVMDDRRDRTLTAEEIALAQLLANHAASAVENARLYNEIRRYVAEMTTLHRIGRVITSSLDLTQTLFIIADHARWLLDVEATSVILYDEESGEMWFGAASGEVSEFVRGKRLAKGQGIVDWVIQRGEPLVVPDASQDPRFFSDWDKETGFTTNSVLCVPLKSKGRTIGAIEVINKARGPFDRKDLTLLTSVAASAAIAIENARFYEQAQQEIAERKRVEANLEEIVARRTRELKAERDRTQAILEAVGEAVIVTDLEGEIQYLNPAAIALTGYTMEEAVGQSPRLWQPEQRLAGPYVQEPGGTATLQTHQAEVVSRRKDGSLYDAAVTVAPLFDSEEPDRLVGHVFVQRDITPIKEAERFKDQFVSNVSHELRTPLSVIALVSGNLDRLYDRLPDEKRRKMIRDLREHAQVLDELVGDVLEVSRIDGGQISMERGEIDLARLACQEVEKQLPLAQRKSQRLSISSVEHLSVWGNDEQLRQVIRNLLNNAIKYTPNRRRIACECVVLAGEEGEATWPGSADLPAGRWAAVRIVDKGIGISPEDLPHVFERFYRVKTQGSIPGTGLGLSIVKELIESHGGYLAASSTPGKGSVFAFYLPLMEA